MTQDNMLEGEIEESNSRTLYRRPVETMAIETPSKCIDWQPISKKPKHEPGKIYLLYFGKGVIGSGEYLQNSNCFYQFGSWQAKPVTHWAYITFDLPDK
jgi:hypothetical protein